MALPPLRLTCTLHEDELVLRMLNGTEHSRLPIDDAMDAAEALELLEAGALPVRLLWTIDRTSDPTTLRALLRSPQVPARRADGSA